MLSLYTTLVAPASRRHFPARNEKPWCPIQALLWLEWGCSRVSPTFSFRQEKPARRRRCRIRRQKKGATSRLLPACCALRILRRVLPRAQENHDPDKQHQRLHKRQPKKH